MIKECPHCHMRNRIPDELGGEVKYRCGSCKRIIVSESAEDPKNARAENSGDTEHRKSAESVLKKIEVWKQQLLDLTRRNRLLHFRASRTSTVRITAPEPEQIFNQLVIKGHSLSFPLPKKERQLVFRKIDKSQQEEVPADDFKPGDFETDTPVKELQNKLYRLRRDWKTWQEEQGVHTLFLSIGILHWYESESELEESLAPLFLIPVLLEKEGLEKPYKATFADEDIIINPTLRHKLDIDFDIKTPELSEDLEWAELDKVLDKIAEKIPDHWKVTDDVWLARFSFDKFAMYRDLEEQKLRAADHPIIRALSNVYETEIQTDISAVDDMDHRVDPEELFPVLDADSSQLEVLVRARSGQNIVIQGPPGTGKSQTIANLIAQSLRDHEKVLFVSEKMAALEVVFRRLKELGLSFACLEVHSHRSNKSKVIEVLAKTLQQQLDIKVPSDALDQFKQMVRRREILNQYVKELHRPRGALNINAYEAYGHLAKSSTAPSLVFVLPIDQAQNASFDDLDRWLTSIRGLEALPEVWDNISTHPWAGDDINLSLFTIEQREILLNAIKQIRSTLERIDSFASSLAQELGIPKPAHLKDIDNHLGLLALLNENKPVAESWFFKDSLCLFSYGELAEEADVHSSRLFEAKKNFDNHFKESLLVLPVEELLFRFRGEYRTISRWLKRQYWEELKKLKSHHISSGRLFYRSAVIGLEIAFQVLSERNWYKDNEPRLLESFGKLYKGAASKWGDIKSGLNWADQLSSMLPNRSVPNEIVALSGNPQELRDKAKRAHEELTILQRTLSGPINALRQIYKSILIEGKDILETPLSVLVGWLNSRTDASALEEWISYLRLKARCVEISLEAFINEASSAQLKSEQLESSFVKRFWVAWISEAHRDSPLLNEFHGQRHEEIIKEFRSLDHRLKHITAKLIQKEIQDHQPKRIEAIATGSQVGILLREAQKRRRHRSLRRLFSEIPDLLQALKPCLLMSPLSVAAYLGTSSCQFDLVIFDEASQIPPEDAIGAIIRGKQLIVAGDNKQLPPTKFFQALADAEDEEDPDEVPLESILDECMGLRALLFPLCLKWHYRSRHEELISFSNREFYDNSLVTFPSPFSKGSTGAVRLVHIPNGIYDRGGTRTNRVEASRTIDLVAEHLRSGKGKSIGIITLGLAQEEAVLQEWEKRKSSEQDLASLVEEEGDEPFFIKALEKVQGDERDYIFISLGFGPDQNGIVHMQFGPINRDGGERRLNVAVTRARCETTLISSMKPQDLDLTRLTFRYRGVEELQKYLSYAQNGGIFREEPTSTGIPESDFEISVREAIESRDFQVDSQVGFSGFRIDLGVRHPDFPGRYILGVECDGATYHSHRTARDRDRLREEVLTALGWKIHRIWSTDWIKDPEKALLSVIKKINDLRTCGDMGTASREYRSHEKSEPAEKSTVNSAVTLEPRNVAKKPAIAEHLQTYEYFKIKTWRPSHWLYEATRSAEREETLFDDLLNIILVEGPIHIQALCSRVRDLYSLERTGGRIQDIVRAVVNGFKYKSHFIRKGDFIMGAGCIIKPRTPGPGEKVRPIEWVALEELAAAAEWLLKAEIGMSRDVLIKGTARIMGYDRTGVNVQKRINKAIGLLLREGKTCESNNQIVVAKKE